MMGTIREPEGLADPFPLTWTHTFTRPTGAIGNVLYHYVDPAVCGSGPGSEWGGILILP